MQSLRPEVNRLRTAVDKGTSNREQYVHKFCTQLDKDIAELDKEAKEIKNEAQVCTYVVARGSSSGFLVRCRFFLSLCPSHFFSPVYALKNAHHYNCAHSLPYKLRLITGKR